MVHLEKVSGKNVWEILKLRVREDQREFVASNETSIIEAYIAQNEHGHAFPFGIYDDETPVGFVLYYFVEDDPDYVFLHRIMIDKHQQGKGYGVRSLELCFEEFKKEFPSIGCVELIHYPDNDRAAAVYEKAGFKLTGGRVKSAPGRIERGSTDVNRTYEVTRRRYY